MSQHIVIHQGSPHPGSSNGNILGLLIMGVLAICALLTLLFYAAIVGAISYAVYWALTRNYTKLKMTLVGMKVHDKSLVEAKENEERVRASQTVISNADHMTMIEAAQRRTQTAETKWRSIRSECANITRDILTDLRESRKQLLENEGKHHDSKLITGRLKDALTKVDIEITRMDCLSRYAEGQLPEKICITDFQDRYACVENEKNSVLRANRENAGQWERFFLIRLEGNRIALLSSNGRFVSADTNKESNLVAVSQALGQREQFELHDILDDYVALKACNGRFVSSRLDDEKTMRACAEDVREWERFRIRGDRDRSSK